jgi:nucleoside-diphosphate-sugar epimerase
MTDTVLVTGATGFIGGHLVRRLRDDGVDVHALVRPGSTLEGGVTGHLVQPDGRHLSALVGELGPTAVYHLATAFKAEHEPDDIGLMLRANVELGTVLADACARACPCPFINVGTAWQRYEGRAGRPTTLYAATKQAMQDVLAYYGGVRRLPVVTALLFDTYGPRDTRRKLVSLLMEAAHAGTPLDMTDGYQLIDLLHVDDVVEALLALPPLADPDAPTHVARSERSITVRALVDEVAAATGKPLAVRWDARPSRPLEMRTDWPLPADIPGWQPRVSLTEGLASVARQWRATKP